MCKQESRSKQVCKSVRKEAKTSIQYVSKKVGLNKYVMKEAKMYTIMKQESRSKQVRKSVRKEAKTSIQYVSKKVGLNKYASM
jgi:hypothetical protein